MISDEIQEGMNNYKEQYFICIDCKVDVKVKHKYNKSIWRKSKVDSVIINLTVLAHRLFIDVDVHYY